jgi:hypothetical protein
MGNKECEPFVKAGNDGSFLIPFEDWCKVYNNLFLCLDFPPEWTGWRFEGQWTEQNCGGTPTDGTKEACKLWGKNPQYEFEMV